MSIGIVSVARALGILTGFGREITITTFYGVSSQTDAYLAASLIPDQIQLLIVSGVLASSFVPILIEVMQTSQDKEEVARLVGTIGALVTLITAALAGLGWLIAPQLIGWLVPGYAPATQALAINLMRFLFPTIILTGIVGFQSSVLNANNRFTVPALVSTISNLIVIVGLLMGASLYGIWGLAYISVASAILQWLAQSLSLHSSGVRYQLAFYFGHPSIPRLFKMALPVFGQLFFIQGYLMGERYLASLLPAGSVTAISYARTLAAAPAGLLVTPIATVLFPVFVTQTVCQDYGAFRAMLTKWMVRTWVFITPVCILLFSLASPIVQLAYERGAFTASHTELVALPFAFFCLGIASNAPIMLLTRGFYAQQNVLPPLIITGACSIFGLALGWYAMGWLGLEGIALAQATQAFIQMLLLTTLLRIDGQPIDLSLLKRSAYKIISATLIMFGVSSLTQHLTVFWDRQDVFTLFIRLSFTSATSLTAYLFTLLLLKNDDVLDFKARIKKFLQKLYNANLRKIK